MGNKRKAALIASAILVCVASVLGAAAAFFPLSSVSNPDSDLRAAETISGNKNFAATGDTSYRVEGEGIYAVLLIGQAGVGASSSTPESMGQGTWAFVNLNAGSSTVRLAAGGGYSGSGYHGGGYAYVTGNFGPTASEVFAGGGGGYGPYKASGWNAKIAGHVGGDGVSKYFGEYDYGTVVYNEHYDSDMTQTGNGCDIKGRLWHDRDYHRVDAGSSPYSAGGGGGFTAGRCGIVESGGVNSHYRISRWDDVDWGWCNPVHNERYFHQRYYNLSHGAQGTSNGAGTWNENLTRTAEARFVRIDIAKPEVSNLTQTYDYGKGLRPTVSDIPAAPCSINGYGFKMQYHTGDGDWTDTIPARSAVGEYDFWWRWVLYNSSGAIWKIQDGSEKFTIQPSYPRMTTEPVLRAEMVYNRNPFDFILEPAEFDNGTGGTPMYAVSRDNFAADTIGSPTWGEMHWTSNFHSIDGIDAGDWYIYVYSDCGNDPKYNHNSHVYKYMVNIAKAENTLEGSWFAHQLPYTGMPQSLFTGVGTCSGGIISYALSTSDDYLPTNSQWHSNIAALTAVNAGTRYYLWGRVTDSPNYLDYPATCLLSAGIGAVMKITLDDSNTIVDKTGIKLKTGLVYNNANQDIYTINRDEEIVLNYAIYQFTQQNIGGDEKFKYYLYYKLPYQDDYVLSDVPDSPTVCEAGEYKIKIMCDGINFYCDVTIPTPVIVDKCALDDPALTLSGVRWCEAPRLSSEDGEQLVSGLLTGAQIIASYGNQRLAGLDSITYHSNALYYIGPKAEGPSEWQVATDYNTVLSGDFAIYDTPYDLPNFRAHLATDYYLYVYIDSHPCISRGALFYGSINVLPYFANDITFLSDNGTGDGFEYCDSVIYDGAPHKIVSGSFWYAQNRFITIEESITRELPSGETETVPNVFYAYSHIGYERPISEWVSDVNDLQVTDAGKYYLWIKWTDCVNCESAPEPNGRKFSMTLDNYNAPKYYFEILKLEQVDLISFKGVERTPSKTFNNVPEPYGIIPAGSELLCYNTKSGASIKHNLSRIRFGISREDDTSTKPLTPPSVFESNINDSSLRANNGGCYYLWVCWDGNDNIASGAIIYQEFDFDDNIWLPLEPFVITPAPKDCLIEIGTNIIEKEPDERRYAEGDGVSLFRFTSTAVGVIPEAKLVLSNNGLPQAGVEGTPYRINGQIKYALGTSPIVAPTEWFDTLEEAKQVNVRWVDPFLKHNYLGDYSELDYYYLWVDVSNDPNLVGGKYYIEKCSKLLWAEAVAYKNFRPTPKADLEADGATFMALFNDSTQYGGAFGTRYSPVEYSIVPNSGANAGVAEGWYDSADDDGIKQKVAKTYYVYYRGKADDNHSTQTADLVGTYATIDFPAAKYPFIIVTIRPADPNFKTRPTNLNLYYIGEGQIPFSQAEATVKDVNTNEVISTLVVQYSYDGVHWYNYGDENLKRVEVGTYAVYYKNLAVAGVAAECDPIRFECSIRKTEISVHSPTYLEGGALNDSTLHKKYYTGLDYTVISSPLAFNLVNRNENSRPELSIGLDYMGQKINGFDFGTIGKIEYGISTNQNSRPTVGYEDYRMVTARVAGTYYLWYRVYAGESYLNSNATDDDIDGAALPNWCKFGTFIINTAPSTNVDLKWSTDTFSNERIRYNGTDRSLILRGDLEIYLNGNLISDKLGTTHYALINKLEFEANGYPSVVMNDVSELWKLEKIACTAVTAGDYYLAVWVEASMNISQFVKLVYIGDSIGIAKLYQAEAGDLKLDGIIMRNTSYNGADQTLANIPSLRVSIPISDTRVTTVGSFTASYIYWDSDNVTPEDGEKWKSSLVFDEYNTDTTTVATARESDRYYLWIRITGNPNIATSYICYDGVVIEKASDGHISTNPNTNISIVKPTLESKIYMAKEQPVLTSVANLSLVKVDGVEHSLTGHTGEARYLITNQILSAMPLITDSRWVDNIEDVIAKEVGKYYIYVYFTEGDNHTELAPIYAGVAEIQKANLDIIGLGSVTFNDWTFDGNSHQMFNGALTMTILGSSVVYDYTKITYAYSTNKEQQPDSDFVWMPNATDLMGYDADEYYLWINVPEDTNVAAFRTCYTYYMYHGQKEDHPYFGKMCGTITQASRNKVTLSGIVASDLSFNGRNQILAQPTGASTSDTPRTIDGLIITIKGNVSKSAGRVLWGLSNGDTEEDTPEEWVPVLTNESLQRFNAGKYYLWAKIEENKNIEEKIAFIAECEIKKALTTVKDYLPAKYQNGDALKYQGSSVNQILLDREHHGVAELVDEPSFRAENFGVVYSLDPFLSLNPNDENVTEWGTWDSVVGQNAGIYTVYMGILDNDNWEGTKVSCEVRIWPRVAEFKTYHQANVLEFNDDDQDLITFGELTDDAALQGCRMEFSETPDFAVVYSYAFDVDSLRYVAVGDELPKQRNVGTYKIYYRINADYAIKTNGYANYTDFIPDTDEYLEAKIIKRTIFWISRPQAVRGLKNNGDVINPRQLIIPGELYGEGASGATVQYSVAKDNPSAWSTKIPDGWEDGLYYCWYRVVFEGDAAKNNEFAEENIPYVLPVLIGTYTLSFYSKPTGQRLSYNGNEQTLSYGGYLSLSIEDSLSPAAPYIVYKLKGDTNWLAKDELPTASSVGKYTVYYKVVYDPTVYTPAEDLGSDENPLSFEAEIGIAYFGTNEIKAVLKNGTLSYHSDADIDDTVDFIASNLGNDFKTEFENAVSYQYRRSDSYHTDAGWTDWPANPNWMPRDIGTYEIRAIVKTSGSTWATYEQSSDFERFEVWSDLTVDVYVKEANTRPTLRVWVDLTGTMSYEDSPIKETGISDHIVLKHVNTPGVKDEDKGVYKSCIRVAWINTGYYYMSSYEVSNKNTIILDASHYDPAKREGIDLNHGLSTNENTNVYIYEVYKISYDANGGAGGKKKDTGWKWHNLDYLLEKNDYSKGLYTANGWNTSPGGYGQAYRNYPVYYKTNASQTFYAQYRKSDEITYFIKWYIIDGSSTYALSRAGDWFDYNLEPSRAIGVEVAEGQEILLPQIETKDFSTTKIFGKLIKGWVGLDEPDVKYYLGIKANRDYEFKAVLTDSSTDYVSCSFVDSDGKPIGTSTRVANGAESYMALSCLSETDIRNYRDGYDKVVEELKDKDQKLHVTNGDREKIFNLGERMPEPEPEAKKQTWQEYTIMFILIAVGLTGSVTAGVVYLNQRKKRNQIRLKDFREDNSKNI